MGRPATENIYIELADRILLRIKYKQEYVDTYIDKEDLEKVRQKQWRTSHKKRKVYIVTGKSGDELKPLTYLHNYLMDYTPIPQIEVDHINGNSCDNRKQNLRLVTRQENINNMNVKVNNKIGIRGISEVKATHGYKCDFIYHGNGFFFKDVKKIEEAVYMRKVAEDYFGMEVLERNPLSKQYIDKLSAEEKQNISQYVLDKISGNGRYNCLHAS